VVSNQIGWKQPVPTQSEQPISVRPSIKLEPPANTGALSSFGIDIKYVGELEAALGGLRVENVNLQETINSLQRKNESLQQDKANLSNLGEEVNKILEENNNLKLEKVRITEELDSRNREYQALSDKHKQILEQLFSASYDKFAFDATVKDNNNLREHIRGMEQLLQGLQQTFEHHKRETNHIFEENKSKTLQISQMELGIEQLTGNYNTQSRQVQEAQQEQNRLQSVLRQKEEMIKLLQSELANSVASVQKLQYVVAHGTAPSN
jgi:regulator of replication initiation timing